MVHVEGGPGPGLLGSAPDEDIDGQPMLHLRFLQARDPRLVARPFRARMRPGAAWLHDLDVLPGEPADLRVAVANAVS